MKALGTPKIAPQTAQSALTMARTRTVGSKFTVVGIVWFFRLAFMLYSSKLAAMLVSESQQASVASAVRVPVPVSWARGKPIPPPMRVAQWLAPRAPSSPLSFLSSFASLPARTI